MRPRLTPPAAQWPCAILWEPIPAGCLTPAKTGACFPLTIRGEKIHAHTCRSDICFVCCLRADRLDGRRPVPVKGPSDPATGENYHVEIGGFLWDPNPQIVISSESLGIVGSNIDFVSDLGIEKTWFKQLRIVLRPAKKHKFRFEYTPITYDAVGTLSTNIVFNGILFPVTFPVATNLQWKAYRFGYEYDFVSRDRGYVGLILESRVHGRAGNAQQYRRDRVRQGARADSRCRGGRPHLRRAEHFAHR